MPSRKRLQCPWKGCPTKIYHHQQLDYHAAQPHEQCDGCERWFTPNGLKSHYAQCEGHQQLLRRAKNVAHSRCAGCSSAIHQGQHYLLIPQLVFKTMLPVDYVPSRDVPDTEIINIVLCGPECFQLFARKNELIENVFGPGSAPSAPAFPRRLYEMSVEGELCWLNLEDSASVLLDVASGFGQYVREADGTLRSMEEFDKAEIRRTARDLASGNIASS